MDSVQQQQLQHLEDHHSIGEESQSDHAEFSSNDVQNLEEVQQNEIDNPTPVIHSTVQQASKQLTTDLESPHASVQLSEGIFQKEEEVEAAIIEKEEVNGGGDGEVDDLVANNTQFTIHLTPSSSSSSSFAHILEHHHAQGGFGNNFYGLISSFAIAAVMNYTMTCMKKDELIMDFGM